MQDLISIKEDKIVFHIHEYQTLAILDIVHKIIIIIKIIKNLLTLSKLYIDITNWQQFIFL